ncbi:MAG: PQQ-dependent sugar dehydrogenase [Thermodesulfobacteriota bacterium]
MNHIVSITYKAGLFACLFIALAIPPRSSPAAQNNDWMGDWSLEEGFNISIDTEGYHFPTAIAFVPEPGSGPKDALYFVTELRGKVKVVTNDRSVYTFARDFFRFEPDEELPSRSGEGGLAGICLDPVHGYVFVTFVYEDENRVLRNNIVRFQSEPGRFSLEPSSKLAFTDVLNNAVTGLSHQIGSCQVDGGTLYVGVGDGYTVTERDAEGRNTSRSVDSVLGKILRMTLDGKPLESNPFYVDDDAGKARNYVWAKGFRNPFGLKVLNGRVFTADNGPSVDRFTEVKAGDDYLWDGTNWSIGANSAQVLSPATGVTQMEFIPADSEIFPEGYRARFYLTLCGFPNSDLKRDAARGIISIRYGFEVDLITGTPRYLLKYRGESLQMVVGLAAGPDGLYFLPLYPDASGRSYALKIRYDRDSRHPYGFEDTEDASRYIEERGCFTCHTLNGYGAGGDGPSLDKAGLVARIEERITSPEYSELAGELDEIDSEPYKRFREARKEVLEKRGMDKVRAWIKYRIMEPRFDDPHARMPNMDVTEPNAQMIADYLLGEVRIDQNRPDMRVRKFMKRFIPELKYRHILVSFALGFSLALLVTGGYAVIRKRTRR